ncbi:hypothetical protein JCM10207_001442 [Rhodosporidiobolus poonsookiae]
MAPKSTGPLFAEPTVGGTDEAIPPLDFEQEDELRAVLDRLKDDLTARVGAKAAGGAGSTKGKGKGKAQEVDEAGRSQVEELVLKQFYPKVEAIILSNCTIGGLSWKEYQKKKKKGELAKTQPFDDALHQRVLKYQNELFDAREVNARERVDAPARTAEYIRNVIDLDAQHLAKLEEAGLDVPDELPLPRAPRSRKSIGGAAALEAPTPTEAQENFDEGKQALDRLLDEVPRLTTAAEEATKVAVDAAGLS